MNHCKFGIVMKIIHKLIKIEKCILVRRSTRSVHTNVSQDRKWILVLVAMNSARGTMPNYYVFKEKWPKKEFIFLCEDGT